MKQKGSRMVNTGEQTDPANVFTSLSPTNSYHARLQSLFFHTPMYSVACDKSSQPNHLNWVDGCNTFVESVYYDGRR